MVPEPTSNESKTFQWDIPSNPNHCKHYLQFKQTGIKIIFLDNLIILTSIKMVFEPDATFDFLLGSSFKLYHDFVEHCRH
jgi:hypothetical protein